MTPYLLVAGGTIFLLLGVLHAAYTLADLFAPRRIVPADPALIGHMRESTVRLSRGGSTMWDAWIGFNLSHSLGAILFALGCIATGVFLAQLALPKAVLLIPVVISALYLAMSLRYWFRIPTAGIAAATVLLFAGWVLY
jgi:hypothetical protein